MDTIKNNFIETLKNTDRLVSRKKIANSSKQLSKSIEIVVQACDSLYGENYSLFLTGSLAVCLRSGSLKELRVSGDKSDIDLWIIIASHPNKSLKPSHLKKEITEGCSRLGYFDISCIPFSGGNLKTSLKIMSSKTAIKILQLKKIKLDVFRYNSLKKIKTENILYGIKKIHNAPIVENKLKGGGFFWYWSVNTFIKKDFLRC